jgi:hypothetical protein
MSTRISSAGALLFLAACSQDSPGETLLAEADPDNVIECAVGGAAAFERVCVIERTKRVGGVVLTVRHPNGSFRNFFLAMDEWSADPVSIESALDTADGAQRASVISGETYTNVTVGADRYRIPRPGARAER